MLGSDEGAHIGDVGRLERGVGLRWKLLQRGVGDVIDDVERPVSRTGRVVRLVRRHLAAHDTGDFVLLDR